jgi:hypothetical protein
VDILARRPDGTLWVYPHTGGSGTSTFGLQYQVGVAWQDITAINVADINGDRRVDILARRPDGTLWVYPHTGGSGTSTFGLQYQVGVGWENITAIT